MPDAPAGDTANKGGAAAATTEEKPLTRTEFLGLLKEALPEMLNPAITGHLKRFGKSVDEKLAKLAPAPKPAEGEGEGEEGATDTSAATAAKPDKGTTTAPAKPAEPDPKLAALEKQLVKLQREAEENKTAAKAERRQRIEQEGHALLTRALSGKVSAGAESTVLAALQGRRAIQIDDAGAVRLRLGGKDEPDEGLDLDEGVAAYLKSAEAKFFLPAPNAGPQGRRAAPFQQQPATGTRPAGAAPADIESAFQAKHGRSIEDALR